MYVIAENPLPELRPIGDNQFELTIPKSVPAGAYGLTAVGVTSELVASQPVAIRVESPNHPTALFVEPSLIAFPELEDNYGMPLRILALFEDGSKLDVTHSRDISFEPKDPTIVKVDDQGKVIPVGPGKTSIMVAYNSPQGTVYDAILVQCPLPKPKGPAPEIDQVTPETGTPGVTDLTISGLHFGETQGTAFLGIGTLAGIVKSWSDTKIVATIPQGTHRGSVEILKDRLWSNAIPFTPPGVLIDGISGRVIPGNRSIIHGSGFGSEQGAGFVTINGVKAQVTSWSATDIVVTVPEFTPTTWRVPIDVHQDGLSGEFTVIAQTKPVGQ